MILKRKKYRLLKKKKNAVLKIQKFWCHRIQRKKILQNLKRLIESTKKEKNEKIYYEPKKVQASSKDSDRKPSLAMANTQTNKKEKFLKQKEAIRNLHEPTIKTTNKDLNIKLLKNNSIKELEERKNNISLGKKSSHHLLINDSKIDEEAETWFTNKMENTKKINNILTNADLVINNLTKIYGNETKTEKQKRINDGKKNKPNDEKSRLNGLPYFNKH